IIATTIEQQIALDESVVPSSQSPRIPNQPFADLTTEEEVLDLLSKPYQEYYACAMGEAAPKPKVSTRKKKGDSASSTTLPTPTPTTTAESAPR
nr:hypothetical protein [Tanacetum cinerariifolium]